VFKEYRRYQLFLVLADVVITLAVFALTVKFRPFLPGRDIAAESHVVPPLVYVMVAMLWVACFALLGVYDISRMPSFSRQAGRVTFAMLLSVLVLAGFLYFTYRGTSRMLVVYFSVGNYAVLLILRFCVKLHMKMRRTGIPRPKVLIVGGTEKGINLAGTIRKEHGSIYELVGFAENYENLRDPLPAALIGPVDEVSRIAQEQEIELVIIAVPDKRFREAEKLVRELFPLNVRIYLVPDLWELRLVNSEIETFGDAFLIGIREPVIEGANRIIKRIFDITVSALLLLVTSPVIVLAWIAVRLDSPGPAIYRADRVGEEGRIFKMLKFRSMFIDAERLQADVIEYDEERRPVYKSDRDPRVTRVGAILRRWSLDELPQLINVLKGEMSLVGPRPEQPFITEEYDYWQWQRLAVPPGITGWWQVSGRSDLPLHLNTQYDLYYVSNYSLFLDVKILLMTIAAVVRGAGAY
jgi:exopolysaccharide biosynthesis polyprenyl glycosylphosphotransferase